MIMGVRHPGGWDEVLLPFLSNLDGRLSETARLLQDFC